MNKYLIMNSNEINEDENIIESNTLTEALIDYIEHSTNGVSIDINILKKTIVPLKETKELIEYINALFLDWDDTIIDIYLLGEHIYNSKDLKR
nr:MAG TPA: haloacid dehalogenase-like hydrolase [Caudoviricetes sp.]